MRFRLVVDDEAHDIEVEGEPPSLTVRVDGAAYRAKTSRSGNEFTVRISGRRHRIVLLGHQLLVDGASHQVAAEVPEPLDRASSGAEGSRSGSVLEVRPPMPGRIVKLAVAAGDRVKRGQTLAVLEAMKMQNEITAPADALVRTVGVREGESIASDRVIALLVTR